MTEVYLGGFPGVFKIPNALLEEDYVWIHEFNEVALWEVLHKIHPVVACGYIHSNISIIHDNKISKMSWLHLVNSMCVSSEFDYKLIHPDKFTERIFGSYLDYKNQGSR